MVHTGRKDAFPAHADVRGGLAGTQANYNNNPILKWCRTNTGIQTDLNGNIVPIKNQSPKQRIDGTAALLDCYVGLYEHFGEYTTAI